MCHLKGSPKKLSFMQHRCRRNVFAQDALKLNACKWECKVTSNTGILNLLVLFLLMSQSRCILAWLWSGINWESNCIVHFWIMRGLAIFSLIPRPLKKCLHCLLCLTQLFTRYQQELLQFPLVFWSSTAHVSIRERQQFCCVFIEECQSCRFRTKWGQVNVFCVR